MSRERKRRIAITVLSTLLAISILALCIVVSRRIELSKKGAVIEDNTIGQNQRCQDGGVGGAITALAIRTPGIQARSLSTKGTEITLKLYSLHPEDNAPFNVENMLPGDSATQNYTLQVSYKGNITVKFKATVLPGYEKLAKVLKIRVELPQSGELIYDGLMRDMPRFVAVSRSSSSSKTEELLYKITTYLDTSVGNEYMNAELTADFMWWAEDAGALEPPYTGDSGFTLIIVAACVAAASLIVILLVWKKGGKK